MIFIFNLNVININFDVDLPNPSNCSVVFDNGFQNFNTFEKCSFDDDIDYSVFYDQLSNKELIKVKIALEKIYFSLNKEEQRLFNENFIIEYDSIFYKIKSTDTRISIIIFNESDKILYRITASTF